MEQTCSILVWEYQYIRDEAEKTVHFLMRRVGSQREQSLAQPNFDEPSQSVPKQAEFQSEVRAELSLAARKPSCSAHCDREF